MVFSIEINLLIVEINRVGTLLMALQIHNATDELVKNKSHILPLSAGNIRRLGLRDVCFLLGICSVALVRWEN